MMADDGQLNEDAALMQLLRLVYRYWAGNVSKNIVNSECFFTAVVGICNEVVKLW